MSAYNHYRARAAEYQQRAENAPNEQDKYSWLALAESWLQTAALGELLEQQETGRLPIRRPLPYRRFSCPLTQSARIGWHSARAAASLCDLHGHVPTLA